MTSASRRQFTNRWSELTDGRAAHMCWLFTTFANPAREFIAIIADNKGNYRAFEGSKTIETSSANLTLVKNLLIEGTPEDEGGLWAELRFTDTHGNVLRSIELEVDPSERNKHYRWHGGAILLLTQLEHYQIALVDAQTLLVR